MTFEDDESGSRRLWWLGGVMMLLAIPLLVIWWPGCRQYPQVTSKESMHLMKLLYAACNTKDPQRLKQVEQGVQKGAQEGKLTSAEQKAFEQILEMARSGQWEQAEKASFRFAQDQVR